MFAYAYERQSVVITTNLEFSRWGAVFGDDQMAAAVRIARATAMWVLPLPVLPKNTRS